MRLGVRLAMGFGFVLVLGCIIAGIGWAGLDATLADLAAFEREQTHAEMAMEWAALTQLNINRALAMAKSDANKEVMAHFDPQIKETSARITQIQTALEAQLGSDAAVKPMIADIAAKRSAYLKLRESIFVRLNAGDVGGARTDIENMMLPAAKAYVASIRAVMDQQRRSADRQKAAMHEAIVRAQRLLLALSTVAVVLGAAGAWFITRSVTERLASAAGATERIAAGDLSVNIEVEGRDEVAGVLAGLARMRDSLRGMVGDVRTSTEFIRTASGEIADGSQDLSGRTEQTASSLQQTAASMEQILTAAQSNAESAKAVNSLVEQAGDTAKQGGDVAAQVVGTMAQIAERSRRVEDIIGTIDGIAFQTNILALNAAVEAARAGTHGRGFAVVASEVRLLAHRAAEAATEVKTLIGGSVETVEEGSRLAQSAHRSMADIVASIGRVSELVREISAASVEQSDGVRQVNQTVSQLDRSTQHNAALVEESTAAAANLRDQALRLSEAVSVFHFA